ncbi:hypothetical protein F0562_013149 [Nyssa sinensis]|uniref:Uncharacterized protein n=1 Tax=Nyssa sinensis TaxID=561372 RepID=A0A5J4ZWL1_9ASTE|nr:hypothetical protein F0562_013149 [Nyssa sinensis]
MTLYICRSLISRSLKNPSYLHRPHISFSFSLFFFSSSREAHPSHTVAVADYLIERHQFSPETASKVSSVVAYLKNPEKSDSVLSFLKETGFSKIHLEQVIKSVPQVLSANLDHNIKPKIKIFHDSGFSPTDIVEIISADPWILTRSANRLGPSILALKNVLGSNVDVSRILKVSGWFLKQDLEKTMKPNIEFMMSCGISSSQITKFVYNFPRFLLHKPESVKEFVKKVDEMGFNRKSGMFLHAIRAVSSMTAENWEHKLELFRNLGFSEDDILSVFRRVPQVFAVSERKIKEATKVLLSTGKYDISFIISHAELLICSVEQRLKPRLRVLEILERKKLLLRKLSITTACKISDKKFFEKYVFPYSKEVGKVFTVNKGS